MDFLTNRASAPAKTMAVIRLRKEGLGILKIARQLGVGTSYVQRIVAELK